jgi:hypothetical protein
VSSGGRRLPGNRIAGKVLEEMMNVPDKKVKLKLVGLDGNAFALMGAFQRQARKEEWTPDEIKMVIDESTSGDYSHLLATLMEVTR